jgi:hypothetical protein
MRSMESKIRKENILNFCRGYSREMELIKFPYQTLKEDTFQKELTSKTLRKE